MPSTARTFARIGRVVEEIDWPVRRAARRFGRDIRSRGQNVQAVRHKGAGVMTISRYELHRQMLAYVIVSL